MLQCELIAQCDQSGNNADAMQFWMSIYNQVQEKTDGEVNMLHVKHKSRPGLQARILYWKGIGGVSKWF
jgi:hypothetical protein